MSEPFLPNENGVLLGVGGETLIVLTFVSFSSWSNFDDLLPAHLRTIAYVMLGTSKNNLILTSLN
jgi:hypothetical protein